MLGKLFKYELRSGATPVPALLAALDLAYIALQDAVIFPYTFSDYSDYQAGVPFLFPDAAAWRRFFASMKRGEKA